MTGVTTGLVKGAIQSALDFGVDVTGAASAAAQGALEGAEDVSFAAAQQVRAALAGHFDGVEDPASPAVSAAGTVMTPNSVPGLAQDRGRKAVILSVSRPVEPTSQDWRP